MGHLHRDAGGLGKSARLSGDKFDRISDQISILDDMYDRLTSFVEARPPTNDAAAIPTGQPRAAAAGDATGFPDASNTGVAAGTTLQKFVGTYYVTEDNANISNLEIHGDIVIDAKNVTMSNVKLVSDTPWHAIRVMDDATGFTLKDSEIDGNGNTVNGIYGFGTFLRNNIHDVHNGINVIGPSAIRENYIHDLRGDSEAHYDGIEINGGHDIEITHNNIVNDHGQTSAIMMDNYFGGLSNILVENNRLVGGGYTVYLDDRFGGGTVRDDTIKIIGNQIGGGYWGDFALYENNPLLSGNTGLDGSGTDGGGDGGGTTDPLVYRGTNGDDVLPASGSTVDGDETYLGLGGNDLLQGGSGADTIDGGDGSDIASYAGSSASVTVNLQAGTATGGDATGDIVKSIESVLGSSHGDVLTGNGNNNVLDGGAGADRLAGGKGNDTYLIDATGDLVAELAKSGTDTARSTISYTLGANLENLVLQGSATNGSGNDIANMIIGTAAANNLKGLGGNDGLYGGAGDDVIDGGSGNDTIEGQSGHDALTGGAGADRFVFRANSLGTANADRITDFSSVDYVVLDVDSNWTGQVAARNFRSGAEALDGDDRFIFDANSDALYYDADGNGSGAKTLIATFDNDFQVKAGDILVI